MQAGKGSEGDCRTYVVLGNRWAWKEKSLGSGGQGVDPLAVQGIRAKDAEGLNEESIHGARE